MQKLKKDEELSSILGEIDVVLKRQNSLGYIFLHGIVRGMGTALGATLLVAVLTSLTLHFAQTPQAETFLKAFVRYIGE